MDVNDNPNRIPNEFGTQNNNLNYNDSSNVNINQINIINSNSRLNSPNLNLINNKPFKVSLRDSEIRQREKGYLKPLTKSKNKQVLSSFNNDNVKSTPNQRKNSNQNQSKFKPRID